MTTTILDGYNVIDLGGRPAELKTTWFLIFIESSRII